MSTQASWRALDRGPVIAGGTSRAFLTGTWRTERPVLDLERCIHCMLCWLYCPDSSIQARDGRVVGIDLDHCKGCGVCAAVCPPRAHAIVMVPEGQP
ncbi:MAG: 4Fe-4S binding protein [Armatimonadota bacterium]|nr:4Fe-4S binding protein [Armatimonadota bacterium]MDR7402189.1 4Fe-4S binding protein [Armatimonadota bacterium]MDR7404639.1 4Fe-4S binding protein [Armatimonadota bacterium]MDR7436946.1 4Fe-4S binding protein [Armatimonadota bacterium]MDR7472280.1 4Fe-4S binding protein [Armatimonadota bacterium]